MASSSKAIIDTNLWISYLISSRLISIDLTLKKGRMRLIFSEELLQEFLNVAKRPKFRKFFSEEDISTLMELFDYYGEIVEVKSVVDICRDPRDNFLLALAKDSQADYLITGDQDLLTIRFFEGTQILTFAEFEELSF